MRTRISVLVCSITSLVAASACLAFDWQYLGMDAIPTTCIESDPLHERLFVGTNEGFHFYDVASGEWTERDDEGQAGRGVTAIQWHPDLELRVITAREDTDGHGYLELSDDLGVTGAVVHATMAGRFLDLAHDGQFFYACGVSSLVAGDLVRSGNGGETWQLLDGHGHFAMTRLALGPAGELYLGGNGVSLSWDYGATWEDIGNGLSPDDAIWGLVAEHPGGDVIIHQVLAGTNDTIYRAEWPAVWSFEPVFAAGCRHLTKMTAPAPWPLMQVVQYVAVTWDGRVLVSRDWGATWQDETGDLPGTPVSAAFCQWDRGLYVGTESHGVFRAQHVIVAVDETPQAQVVELRAWPNPFNPSVNLRIGLPIAGITTLDVFDLRGRRVAQLGAGWFAAGKHDLHWDAEGQASGAYLLRLASPWGYRTERLTLVR